MDTLEQMQHILAGIVGRRLLYRELVRVTRRRLTYETSGVECAGRRSNPHGHEGPEGSFRALVLDLAPLTGTTTMAVR